MTPLPPPLGTGEVVFWRLDEERFTPTWDSGEGSFRVGGRWNARGRRVVYASLDPSTAILEVAVHKGFPVLDTSPHVLTRARIPDPGRVHVVRPADVPNPHWLHPGQPSAGQREFGAVLLTAHTFVAFPSAVSSFSWNLIFDPAQAKGLYDGVEQTRFALDPRLHPDLA
jgi:RES domain-containing protein